jgi:hypothetical protein
MLYLDYIAVILFGGLVGATELLSRYRDKPFHALTNPFGLIYITVNSVAAMLTLWIIRAFSLDFGLEIDGYALSWVQVMAAGFSSMALFRSSLFVFRVGDQDVNVGPSSVLSILLNVLDREVDRSFSLTRAQVIQEIMKDVSYGQARVNLEFLMSLLLQNLEPEEQAAVNTSLARVEQVDRLTESAKAVALGLILLDYLGEKSLREAIKLNKFIKTSDDKRKIGNGGQEAAKDVVLSAESPVTEDGHLSPAVAQTIKNLVQAQSGNEVGTAGEMPASSTLPQ